MAKLSTRRKKRHKKRLLLRDKKCCAYCGVRLTINTMTKDHIVPLAHGGTGKQKNLITCCFKCNNLKGSKSKEEFLIETGYYWKFKSG